MVRLGVRSGHGCLFYNLGYYSQMLCNNKSLVSSGSHLLSGKIKQDYMNTLYTYSDGRNFCHKIMQSLCITMNAIVGYDAANISCDQLGDIWYVNKFSHSQTWDQDTKGWYIMYIGFHKVNKSTSNLIFLIGVKVREDGVIGQSKCLYHSGMLPQDHVLSRGRPLQKCPPKLRVEG